MKNVFKRVMLFVAVVATACTMSAQVYIGGSIGYNSTDLGDLGDKVSTFSIAPEVGFGLNENWTLGVSLKYEDTDVNDLSTFGIEPYARYTFKKWNKVSLFGEGYLAYEHYNYGDEDFKANGFGLGVRPGLAIAITDKFSLVTKLGNLGFSSVKPDYDDAESLTEFDFNIDGAVSFGFYYTF